MNNYQNSSENRFLCAQIREGKISIKDKKIKTPVQDENLAIALIYALKNSKNDEMSYIFNSLSIELKQNINVMKIFIQQKPEIFEFLHENIKNNSVIIKTALRGSKNNFRHLSVSQQQNIDFIKIVINNNRLLSLMKSQTLENKELILYILDKNPDVFLNAPIKIREMEDICRFLVKRDLKFIAVIQNINISNDMDIAKQVVKTLPNLFSYLG